MLRLPLARHHVTDAMNAATVSAPADVTGANAHNGAIDALRVLGAGVVFIKHSSLATRLQLRPSFRWMNHFEIGPTLFFVLSAYLVYLPVRETAPRRTSDRCGVGHRTTPPPDS